MFTQKREESEINQERIIDQIRCLGIDMIDQAQSGHPGIVLGAAPIIYTLYAHHLRFDVENPDYFNRDRFILSAGHGSALLYATLYMAGFPITLEDLKQFRQIDSITPGHPELGKTPGVDMTTGPLGQGVATAVGMAMAEATLRMRYNKGKREVIDFYTYVLCGDGDLMEGISYEALSLAGSLGLNKLIVLYDSNDVCLDGKTHGVFDDNIAMRFVSMGWNVITVTSFDGYDAISKAIDEAKTSSSKPTLIEVKTIIGKDSMLQGTNLVHGSPLSKEDIAHIKEKVKIRNIPFTISKNTCEDFQYLISNRCRKLSEKFDRIIDNLSENEQRELAFFMGKDKSLDLKDLIYEPPVNKCESTRDTSFKVLNSLVSHSFYLLGGSADLFRANKTYISDGGDYSREDYGGKNIFFGVREHAMGAILNGLALCGFRPYGSTFLSFSDYLRPSMRLACMMDLGVIYIFSHDSISIGEDGPTHQPVEQLATLRAMPNLDVFRPADANEVIGAYKAILSKKSGPSVITLSKTELPILETTRVSEVEKGGYIVLDPVKKADGIIISTGEEVSLAIEVATRLQEKGIQIRVVSMPNLSRFLEQDDAYIEQILPVEIRKIVIEAASSMSWNRLVFNPKYLITLDQFGSSGKRRDVYQKFGYDLEHLEKKVEKLLK